MYEISEISTNLPKMYEYPMYCKMLGICGFAILKKKKCMKKFGRATESIQCDSGASLHFLTSPGTYSLELVGQLRVWLYLYTATYRYEY